jgi:hypothetical protein
MTVWVAEAHAHIQRLVSVVEMETVLEDCNAGEQRPIVHFYGQKDSKQWIIIKLLVYGGSVCRVKWFTAGSRNSLKGEEVETEVRKTSMLRVSKHG